MRYGGAKLEKWACCLEWKFACIEENRFEQYSAMNRNPTFENLELRRPLASDWHNASLPCDVDGTELVTPLDALVVINALNRDGSHPLSQPNNGEPLMDVDADGYVTPLDVLSVINVIARNQGELTLAVGADSSSDPNGNGVILVDAVLFVGETAPFAKIGFSSEAVPTFAPLVTQADANGRFRLAVPVGTGITHFRFEVNDELGRTVEISQDIRRGDIVADWNAAALDVIRGWTSTSNDPYHGRIVPSQPPMVARNLAMIQAAMFDAINAVRGTYHGYALNIVPQAGASEIAAAATAAYEVASSLYTAAKEQSIWDASLSESLALVPDGDAKTLGITLGKQAASAMLSKRANDLKDAVSTYTQVDAPGHWNRTTPDNLPPLLPQWPSLKPFVLSTGSQFRPESPPSLGSIEYAEAVDQVMSIGGVDSTKRTSEQTQIALFWADGAGTATPPGHWNRIATDVLLERSGTLLENARTMALLNLSMADSGIASWDAKYHYDLWRPIDAIREAVVDGNVSTVADTNWVPFLKTPPFPSYTSGHSTFSGAAAVVLTALLGENVSFTSSIDPQNAPSQRPLAEAQLFSRQFTSFNQAASEAGMSRIYGGIHFGFDDVAGRELGGQVGLLVLGSELGFSNQ